MLFRSKGTSGRNIKAPKELNSKMNNRAYKDALSAVDAYLGNDGKFSFKVADKDSECTALNEWLAEMPVYQ